MWHKSDWHPRGSLFERPIINVEDDIRKMQDDRLSLRGRRILDDRGAAAS